MARKAICISDSIPLNMESLLTDEELFFGVKWS